MGSDDSAVAMARVTHAAAVPAIDVVRRWVCRFAHEHGMRETDDVAIAVSEAVTNVVVHAYAPEAPGDVTVDAATDGRWLTVRIADRGRGTQTAVFGLGLPLLAELADRVEVAPGVDGVGTVVVMEFPMRGGDESLASGPAPQRRRQAPRRRGHGFAHPAPASRRR